MLTQRLKALALPEGVLLLVATALVHWGTAMPQAGTAVRAYPVVVLAAGALLAWRFRSGRLALALLALVLADRAMVALGPLDAEAAHAGPVVVRTLAVLLAITMALLAFAGERGLFTNAGLRRLGVLAGQAAAVVAVWLVSTAFPEPSLRAFDASFVSTAYVGTLPLGQPATLVALLAIAALVGRILWRPDAEARGFLWAAVACVIAASVGPAEGRATLHLANAGLVLVVATVEGAYAMAFHDQLTGLPGRRALDDALMRVEGTYTVAMVDVDHFKKFNDTHGHDVGDQVLRMVASRLGRVTGGGRAFRYGGEEFAVLFAGRGVDEAAPHLEALRESVEEASFALRAKGRPRRKPAAPRKSTAKVKRLAVTVSIGAAEAAASRAPKDVVKAADAALYRAKASGRNRVET